MKVQYKTYRMWSVDVKQTDRIGNNATEGLSRVLGGVWRDLKNTHKLRLCGILSTTCHTQRVRKINKKVMYKSFI